MGVENSPLSALESITSQRFVELVSFQQLLRVGDILSQGGAVFSTTSEEVPSFFIFAFRPLRLFVPSVSIIPPGAAWPLGRGSATRVCLHTSSIHNSLLLIGCQGKSDAQAWVQFEFVFSRAYATRPRSAMGRPRLPRFRPLRCGSAAPRCRGPFRPRAPAPAHPWNRAGRR